MRRVTLRSGVSADEVADQLRAGLGPGVQVSVEGSSGLVVRRGRFNRCRVTLRSAPEGTDVEVRGDSGGVPAPVLRWLGDLRIAPAVTAVLSGQGSGDGSRAATQA